MIEPKPSTVLVVDDNAIIRRLQEAQIEALRVQIVAASGGDEALTLMRSIQPDLILLDVVMPGMDGFRVCEAIKADPATREVPVIVVTALGKDARDRSFAAGADDFMRKPPNTLLLRARAMAHLRIHWAGGKGEPAAGPVLLACGDPDLDALYPASLPQGSSLLRATSLDEARGLMDRGPIAAILDLGLEGSVAFARELRAGRPELPILLAHRPEAFTILEEEHPPVDDYLEIPATPAEARHRTRLLLRLAAAEAGSQA